MAKTKYVTDDYIEKVEHYLNNDLPVTDLYSDIYTTDFDQSVVDIMLKKGERYTRLKEDEDYVAITSFGRLINTKRITQYSLRFTQNTIVAYVASKKVDIPAIFKQEGWKYDFKKILNNYRKYNWTLQDTTKYSYYADRVKPKK